LATFSGSYAELNALFGFDFFVVGRIDYQEKAATKTMETIWRPGNGSREIMTHALDPIQFYSYPPGFNLDRRTWVTESNVASRANDFAAFIQQKAQGYATHFSFLLALFSVHQRFNQL